MQSKKNKLLLHSLHQNNLDVYVQKTLNHYQCKQILLKSQEFKYDTEYRKLKTLILLNKNINLQNDIEGKFLNSN